MSIHNLFKNMIFACLGIQEVFKEFLADLVRKGKMSESEAAKIVNEFMKKSEDTKEKFKENLKEMIQKSLQRMNLPTKEEIEALRSTINELSIRISKIEEKIEKD